MEKTNPLRLSLMLNYSCFCYDVMEKIEYARSIAKSTFDFALKEIEMLNDEELKQTLPLM